MSEQTLKWLMASGHQNRIAGAVLSLCGPDLKRDLCGPQIPKVVPVIIIIIIIMPVCRQTERT